jgi:hypothetical protein
MRAIALLALLTACSHVQLNANTGAPGGTVAGTSSASVQVQGSGTLAAVILAGMLLAAASADDPQPRPFPSLSVLRDWMGAPPPMDPNRSVNEQDCTKPVQLTDNLRCK